ncbi:SDR family NAD(P)-dependent oxidoreductase [Frankia sp. AgB32]|uniref:SDR family NAD(P)-dependent oxidoreductase n=1 Tax=Frankia sp. AgB32 TaxID=631119 RepID=UPI00200FC661|nr:SDR family NAD(P)-dependent oxidoreductase [Frankia sp. AgB32]MCK9898402.1 SDR family NAD(P)-dependent oxidoreductase [Frankia sp. AgB32]
MDLTGRSAIVTGGAGGLGSAVVRHLADIGVKVVVLDIHEGRTKEIADGIGKGAVAVSGDTNDDDVVLAAISAGQSLGVLSIVVNVAGGGLPTGRTVGRDGSPTDKESFVKTLEMNATGTFNVTRLAAAAMAHNEPTEDGERGVIINTASIAGYEGQAGQVAYGTAKAAILGMSLPLARDLAPLGIRVNAIAPGTMGTPLMLSAPDKLKERLIDAIQFPKRLGKPEEFALLVESLIRNSYINGENIRLDGGVRFPPK